MIYHILLQSKKWSNKYIYIANETNDQGLRSKNNACIISIWHGEVVVPIITRLSPSFPVSWMLGYLSEYLLDNSKLLFLINVQLLSQNDRSKLLYPSSMK